MIIREFALSSSYSLLVSLASIGHSTRQDSDGQMDVSDKKGESKMPGPRLPADSTASTGQSTWQDFDGQMHSSGKKGQNKIPDLPPTLPMDLAEKIKGMYRLLDLINESKSNGCGNEPFPDSLLVF
jgi:hypothetical protein